MKMLKAKVLDWNLDQKRKDMEKFYGKKGDIAWGNQIRSYVLYPYTMVKDHRTDVETSNAEGVLDGVWGLLVGRSGADRGRVAGAVGVRPGAG
jgi:peptide chain release factor 2